MATDTTPTVVSDKPADEVLSSLPAEAQAPKHAEATQTLFDSIARENFDVINTTETTPLRSVFTGLMWFGYTIAIIVALVLVWSAAGSLMKALPQ